MSEVNLPPLPYQYFATGVYTPMQLREYARAAVLADRETSERTPAWKCACGANLYIDAEGAPRSKAPQPVEQRKPLTDEQIDTVVAAARDDLLDLIYEYGTTVEGVLHRVRMIARAIEAAHSIGKEAT